MRKSNAVLCGYRHRRCRRGYQPVRFFSFVVVAAAIVKLIGRKKKKRVSRTEEKTRPPTSQYGREQDRPDKKLDCGTDTDGRRRQTGEIKRISVKWGKKIGIAARRRKGTHACSMEKSDESSGSHTAGPHAHTSSLGSKKKDFFVQHDKIEWQSLSKTCTT